MRFIIYSRGLPTTDIYTGNVDLHTCDVILCSALPDGAWLVTRPRNTLAIVLKKLDFPDPTGPISKILDSGTWTFRGGQKRSISALRMSMN